MKKPKKIYQTWVRSTLCILGMKPYRARIYKLTHESGNIVYQIKFYKEELPEKIVYSEGNAIEYANKGIAFLKRQQTIAFEL